jgi:hypothetical protein
MNETTIEMLTLANTRAIIRLLVKKILGEVIFLSRMNNDIHSDGSILRAVRAAGRRYWAPHYKYITSQRIEESHQLGIQVFVWT